MGVVVPRPDGWLLHTNHFLDRALSGGECMPDSSTTRERFAHLNDVVNGMTSADVRERAAAMCGAAGDQAVVCFHPDLSMPDTERWETLLTVGIDTDACALDYVAGNPHDLARDGACGSDVTYDARRAVGGSGKAGRHVRAARVTLMRRCARPCRPAARTTGCRQAPSRRYR